MKKIAALVALAAILLMPVPSHAADQTISWSIVASTAWRTGQPCVGFKQLGIMTGIPFTGAFSDQACFTGVELTDPTKPTLGYSGPWFTHSQEGTEGLWGFFQVSTAAPSAGGMLDATGTFTITGGILPTVQCPALICPSQQISGGGTVHVTIPWGSAAYLVFQGTLHTQ